MVTLAASAPTSDTNEINQRRANSCKDESLKPPSWTALDFYFTSEISLVDPTMQVQAARVSFNLTNTALSFNMSCVAFSQLLPDFFYGDTWFNCTGPGTGEAEFKYNRTTGQVDVKQKWRCDDDPAQYG